MKGHVRERGKGNWDAVLDVRDPATGKRRRKWHSLKAKGKREAQSECSKIIAAMDTGGYVETIGLTVAQTGSPCGKPPGELEAGPCSGTASWSRIRSARASARSDYRSLRRSISSGGMPAY